MQLPKGTKMIVTAHLRQLGEEQIQSRPDEDRALWRPDLRRDDGRVLRFRQRRSSQRWQRWTQRSTTNTPASTALARSTFTIAREGDNLMFTAPGQPKIRSVPRSRRTCSIFKVIDAQVTFIRNEAGNVTELLFEINGRKHESQSR